MDTADVVIAGAGIIGLSSALELAAAGLRVTVIERGRAMGEASWAAAGMLAGNDPGNPWELRELANLSMELYPEYLRRVEKRSGHLVPFRSTITLQGFHAGDRPHDARIASGPELQSLVPGLVLGKREFLILEERSIDPRDLCTALPLAAADANVTLVEGTRVMGVDSVTGHGVEVRTDRGAISAGSFVNCCGAWSAELSSSSMPPAIRPCKGQMVSVRLAAGDSLPCVLRTAEVYLVPRGDDRVVIGATVEDAGFDKDVSQEAIESLLCRAAALFPPIGGATVGASWAGLRPASADGLPVLGVLAGGSFVATGHFRNGILLAPGTARIVSQLVQGVTPEIYIIPFRATRFHDASALPAVGENCSANRRTIATVHQSIVHK